MALHIQHTLRKLRPALIEGQLRAGNGCRWLREDSSIAPEKALCSAACVATDKPACRGVQPEQRTGLRVVCCPPPAGHKPPCKPTPPSCSITCDNFTKLERHICSKRCTITSKKCGVEQNLVSIRLAAANEKKRLDYEKEVATRKKNKLPPEYKPFILNSDRMCASKTANSHDTAISCEVPRCGPNRTPPEPQCVTLPEDNDCKIKGQGFIDPCAYKPSVITEIDRSGQTKKQTEKLPYNNTVAQTVSLAKTTKQSTKGITSRIMDSFKMGRSGKSEQLPVDKAGIGSGKWCKEMLSAKPPGRPCCPSGLADKFQTRQPGPCSRTENNNKRSLHTTVTCHETKTTETEETQTIINKTKLNNEKLNAILMGKEKMKEVAQGRFVRSETQVKVSARPRADGQMNIRVPPGTDMVHVRVTLSDNDWANTPHNTETSNKNNAYSQCGLLAHEPKLSDKNSSKDFSIADKCSSWIHKKLSRVKGGNESKKETSCSNPSTLNTPETSFVPQSKTPVKSSCDCQSSSQSGDPVKPAANANRKSTREELLKPPASPNNSSCNKPVKQPAQSPSSHAPSHPCPPCGALHKSPAPLGSACDPKQSHSNQNAKGPIACKVPPKKTCFEGSSTALNDQFLTIFSVPRDFKS